jgi:O-antigen/teichoic acid export membrane protein
LGDGTETADAGAALLSETTIGVRGKSPIEGSLEAGVVAAGQALAALGAVVGVRLLTDAMPPSSYGELALAMTAVTLLQQTLILPVQSAALRFFSVAVDLRKVEAYKRTLFWLVGRIIAIIALLGCLVGVCASLLHRKELVLLTGAATVFVVFMAASMTIDGVQNAARRRLVTAWHDALSAWARFLLAAWLLHLASSTSSAIAMGGYALAALCTLISQGVLFRPRLATEAACTQADLKEMRAQMLRFGAPLSVFGLCFALQVASERWSLLLFASASQVGEYAVLVQLGYYPIVTLSNFLVQLATPIVYEHAGSGTSLERLREARLLVTRFLLMVGALTVVAALVAGIVHAAVFRLLVAPEYREVSSYLPMVVASAGLLACGQVASLSLMAESKTAKLMVPKLVTGLLASVGSFVGAHFFQLAGVVGAGFIASACYCIWVVVLTRGEELPSANHGETTVVA